MLSWKGGNIMIEGREEGEQRREKRKEVHALSISGGSTAIGVDL